MPTTTYTSVQLNQADTRVVYPGTISKGLPTGIPVTQSAFDVMCELLKRSTVTNTALGWPTIRYHRALMPVETAPESQHLSVGKQPLISPLLDIVKSIARARHSSVLRQSDVLVALFLTDSPTIDEVCQAAGTTRETVLSKLLADERSDPSLIRGGRITWKYSADFWQGATHAVLSGMGNSAGRKPTLGDVLLSMLKVDSDATHILTGLGLGHDPVARVIQLDR